eukprot:2215867-Pleurochrysis_carterae.AAC.1
MYAVHRAGIGATPPGCWRVRIAGGRVQRRMRSRGGRKDRPKPPGPHPGQEGAGYHVARDVVVAPPQRY